MITKPLIKYHFIITYSILIISCSEESSQTPEQDTHISDISNAPDTNEVSDQSDGQNDGASLCGNGTIDEGEACDDGPNNSDTLADACRTNCQQSSCGDGVTDLRAGESCDDGNSVNDDGCTNLCQFTNCGDGVLQSGETCDDGPANSDTAANACRTDCTPARCGDSVTDTNEACDDGNDLNNDACIDCVIARCGDGIIRQNIETCDDENNTSLDGCSDQCLVEFGFECQGEPSTCISICGDGKVSSLETCDDANTLDGDYCASDCSAITGRCGDNTIQSNEICDDGNTQNGDQCAANCQAQPGACGDGTLQANEVCDDGNPNPNDYCSPDCQSITGFCGDNTQQTNETCDDGNTDADDYCSPNCAQITGQCGDAIIQNNEICDDGNFNSGDYCTPDCQDITGFCGDNIIQSNETCDDGNNQDGDSCSANCSAGFNVCGDGVLDPGEVCDDGNLATGDYCASDCQSITGFCGDGLLQLTAQEGCDDGNNIAGDYCSPNCQQITGQCGDFTRQINETCEDRNTNDLDGCSSSCQVEFGYQCTTTVPNICQDTCGDGLKSAAENCDDGNLIANDGCNALCQVEFSYECTGNAPSICTTTCGDGAIQNSEICDDGNTINDDGCDACRPSSGYLCESCTSPPNLFCATADEVGSYQNQNTPCQDATGTIQCLYQAVAQACDSPPPTTSCSDADARLVYLDGAADCTNIGSGTFGCAYPSISEACDTPPPDVCISPNSYNRYYDGAANCAITGGAADCIYTSTTINCDLPPASSCSGNTLTTYSSPGLCSVSGSNATCIYPSTSTLCSSSGQVCGADTNGNAACITPPLMIFSVDYPVIAHGGKLVITGANFTDVTSVTIGGVPQTFTVNSNTQITINVVTDAVPLDRQSLVINGPNGVGSFNVTVVHLVIREIDVSELNNDNHEMIEVYTGISRSIQLSGYHVVQISGGSGTPTSVALGSFSGHLGDISTPSTGYFVMAPNESNYTRQATFTRDSLLNNNSSIAIYQRPTSVPNNTPAASITGNLIDAVVYITADTVPNTGLTALLNFYYGTDTTNPKRTYTDEGSDSNTNSISRCNSNPSASPPYTSSDRMDGRVFKTTATETPGAANSCN